MRVWVVPLSGLVAGVLLAIAMLAIDRASGYDLVSQTVTGDAPAAESLLSTIITAVVTLMSVGLTVMTVAVQLAMGQFSRAAVEDLKTVASPERRAVLDEQLQLLVAAVRRDYRDELAARTAAGADLQGLG